MGGLPASSPSDVREQRGLARGIRVPFTERVLTRRGPILARDLHGEAEEVHEPTPVFRVRAITGHEVRVGASARFQTPQGGVAVEDLGAGDQVLLQSNGWFWNPSRELPASCGGRDQWSPELGALLGRVVGSGWFASSGERDEVWISFPRAVDPGRVFRTRGWLTDLTGCTCKMVSGEHRIYLVADAPGARGLRALGLSGTHSGQGAEGTPGQPIPEAVFRAPEDIVEVFVRSLLEDRATLEEGAVRLEGPTEFLADLQELLAYFGVLSVRWDHPELAGAELILPPRGVRALPGAARPREWEQLSSEGHLQAPPHDGVCGEPLTTILEVVPEGSWPCVMTLGDSGAALPAEGALTSLRGFLLQAG